MAKSPAIGIDLGTTYTCVGVFRHGRVEVIANEQGPRTTPSYVAFTDSQRLIGEGALNQVATNSQNTVFDVKRLIGRKFHDEVVKNDMKHWPFKVINHNGDPKIQVQFKGETRDFYPEEISSMVLSKMKEIAESHLGQKVAKAVITVPAYFDDSQRQATKVAATIAGLEVMRIINEPTAAAIAYGLLRKPKNQNVLVFDFGGGTIDVSILNIKNKRIVVKSTGGYTHLGGKDIDDILVGHLMRIFKEMHKKDISNDQKALARLRVSAEHAKRTLSAANKASVNIDCLFDGTDFSCEIRIGEFNQWCDGLFQSTLTYVEKALRDAKMKKTEIHEVILVGGSSRIPRIQKLLQDFFGKELNKSVNLDETVAEGAAVHAAILNGESDKILNGLTLKDVTPMSLGVIQHDGKSDVIIARNSPISCTKAVRAEINGNETNALIKVFEGEEPIGEDNNILGIIIFSGNIPHSKGKVQLKITFSVDEDGILNVSVEDKAVGIVHKIQFKNEKFFRSKEELDRLIEDASRFEDEEKTEKEREEALTRLELYCVDMMLTMTVSGEIPDFCESTVSACKRVYDWIIQNKLARKEVIEMMENHLHQTCDPIIQIMFKLKTSNEQEASVGTSVASSSKKRI